MVIVILKLEKVSPAFPLFDACLERELSRTVATDDRKQFKWLNIVLKTQTGFINFLIQLTRRRQVLAF